MVYKDGRMHKFTPETLELFRIHQWSIAKHLDKIVDAADRAEIEASRATFKAASDKQTNCQECKESVKTRGFVCESHYHDYCNQGINCCWTCYVMTVCETQLGIYLD